MVAQGAGEESGGLRVVRGEGGVEGHGGAGAASAEERYRIGGGGEEGLLGGEEVAVDAFEGEAAEELLEGVEAG